jgi:ketosteroid isomerase-like protein
MTERNAKRLRGMIEDFNTGGVEAALAHVDPEITWHAPPEWLEKSVYTGHDGLRELATSWGQNFEEYRLDMQRVVDLDADRVFALLYQRGRIKGSGAEMEHAVSFIAEIAADRVTRVDVFFSWEAGLEAAGLRE